MTKKTRNWLIFSLSIPTAVILAIIGLLVFQGLQPLPPIQPLPNPNGYDDLVKAGQMASTNSWNYEEMNETQLRETVAASAEALSLARTGLSNQCRVPLQFSESYMSQHLSELAGCKRLAQTLAAEGWLADMEGRPGDAAKSYLDAVRLGNKSARGGIIIDQLVGSAIEAIGTSYLQKHVDQFDAKTCRDTAATLEILDQQRQTWAEVMQQERAWSYRAYTSVRYKLIRLMMHNTLNKTLKSAENRYEKQQTKTRQLIINLAARAYELDKGHQPASLSDLVPDYLKAIPQDPLTGTNMVYLPR